MSPFADYEDFDDCVAQNQDKESPEGFCAWLHYEITGEWPGEKEAKKMDISAELTAPICWKDEDQRIVYGPVLIPNEPDKDGDVVSAQKIEEVAHNWLEKYQTVDVQHGLFHGGRPIESYVAPQDLNVNKHSIPQGSWIMGVKVDEEQWAKVKSGELTGFSIMAVPVGAEKAEGNAKRVTLADLGDDWEVVAVSLVDNPAVPKAKWIAIKRNGGLVGKLKDALTIKTGREISDANFKDLNSAYEAIGKILERARKERAANKTQEVDKEMDEKEIKALFEQWMTEREAAINQTDPEPPPVTEPVALTEERVGELITAEVGKSKTEIIGAFEEALKKRGVGKSLAERITGQDGHDGDKSPITSSRDPWGRKIKTA